MVIITIIIIIPTQKKFLESNYKQNIYIYIYIYIWQETSVCMCCIVKMKQKKQSFFDEFLKFYCKGFKSFFSSLLSINHSSPLFMAHFTTSVLAKCVIRGAILPTLSRVTLYCKIYYFFELNKLFDLIS